MTNTDLSRLWAFPFFDRPLRAHYGLDARRHLRYDGNERVIYYCVRRSVPRNLPVGRFAVDEKTLQWLLSIERHGQVENAFVVLVEDWRAPPRVVWSCTARALWEKLDRIVPLTGTDGGHFWWLDDSGEPQDVWIGPVLRTPPF